MAQLGDTIRHPSDEFCCRSMSPDGTGLVLCGAGCNIVFWCVNMRQTVWETATDGFSPIITPINTVEPTKITNSVAWDPSSRIFVLCGKYGTVQWFDLSNRTPKILNDISTCQASDCMMCHRLICKRRREFWQRASCDWWYG